MHKLESAFRTRFVTLFLLSGLALFFALREKRIAAADTETITWGATDPTWSPDGKRLAFSLFGSIWQVSSDGGEAQQVSVSEGYHAHPAWSPKGDQIAFISGREPAGRIPNISGTLRVVDPESGVEREIAAKYTTAGSPAWSPDGARLVCGFLTGNFGSLLHEIRLADGAVTQIQQPIQRGPVGPWNDAAWSAANNEVFFAVQRTSAPQIWSMPAGGANFLVQLPLTGYRREDIVQLNSLSAIPDGSGVIYSAVVVNRKGNYELYRVGRQGGKPVAITNTERDEFAPAVSPNGREVAHVSNHLGNIDLFVMPIAGGAKRHVRLTGLKFRRPSGRVRVKTLDTTGEPTPVRLYTMAADKKSYMPAGSAAFYNPVTTGAGRQGFYVGSGNDEFPAPAGPLRLTALKGIEYRMAEKTIDVPAGETVEVTIQMERWTNWNQRGWYTGENHFHANYNGTYYQRPKQSLGWLEAEDLNAANMIVANSEGAFVHDKEFFRGAADPISKTRYVLYWGQEYRNSDPLGHMAFLNIKKQVPPSYTSVIGSDSPYDFPLNTMAALEARKQGGLVSYVHPMGGPGQAVDVFDSNLGAKEAPLTAALGGMDAVDILPRGKPAYELWYRLLNSGFQILPGAGTDVFTNWRGVNGAPGGSRQYVDVGSNMSWNRWIERYREGRAFVTNAPLMTFQANGMPMGSVIRVPAGQPYRARLAAEITSRVPLSLVELVQNGKVIETLELPMGATSARLDKEVPVERSCWFAVRVTGPPASGVTGFIPNAHSGPIYVHVGDAPTLVREDLELMVRWLNRLWAYLEERNNFGPGDRRARARAMFDDAIKRYQAKLTLVDASKGR